MSEDLTIREQLETSFEDAESPAVEETVTEPVADTPPETNTDAPVEGAVVTEGDDAPITLTAPEHWSEAHRDTFTALAPEGQQFLLDRHKEMEGDYTKKSMEQADYRKTWEPVEQIFAPYQQQMAQTGQVPADFIGRMLNFEQRFDADPLGVATQLLQEKGIDINNIPISGQEGFVDPEIANLRQELNQLQGSLVQREQSDYDTRRTTVDSNIQNFKDEKTEAGELAHPHFDLVLDDLAALAAVERQAGREPDLGQLYDKAVWMNPEVRETVLKAQREAAHEDDLAGRRQKAARAQEAGRGLTGTPDGATPSEDRSIREELEQGWSG